MTEIGQLRAVKVLLDRNGVLGQEHRLPKVYVVGDEVCIFLTAALRQQRNHYSLTGEKIEIEIINIKEAYGLRHNGREFPESWNRMVDWNFNSTGNTYHKENWYTWQIAMYKDDPVISSIFNRV